jgi:hypothetical protein
MALILKKLTAITTSCRGKLLSWKERGILLGEIAVEVTGCDADERICFAIAAKHDICLAGASLYESIYPELSLPVTLYLVEMQQGTVTFRQPGGTLPETVLVLARRLQKYLRRQLGDEDSFESLIEELATHRTQFVHRAEIEKRFKQSLQLLVTAFDQHLKNRLRRYAFMQEIRAELETMCIEGTRFIEEFHFKHSLPATPAGGLSQPSPDISSRK